jgi:16S rRNA G1207 methylase RsmC
MKQWSGLSPLLLSLSFSQFQRVFMPPAQEDDERVNRAREVREIYALGATEPNPYEISCAGLILTAHPNVFSPRYFNDSEWFALEVARIVNGRSFLDMGTGTGIIGLRAAIPDPALDIFAAATVTSVDINPDAVATARINFDRYGIRARILCGDMYAPLQTEERFEVIFWNHPFNKGIDPNEEILLRAGFDYQYESLHEYIQGAQALLTADGQLLLGTGNVAPLHEIEAISASYDYSFELLTKTERPMGPQSSNPNDFRIYRLRKL